MKYVWQDLPEKKNLFTKRNATMVDLRKKNIVQYYSANTKIVVVQKSVTPAGTFYRTASAAQKGLDWAFEASVFGLPNEFAPLAPSVEKISPRKTSKPVGSTHEPEKKQTLSQGGKVPKSGEEPGAKAKKKLSLWQKLFRRK